MRIELIFVCLQLGYKRLETTVMVYCNAKLRGTRAHLGPPNTSVFRVSASCQHPRGVDSALAMLCRDAKNALAQLP